MAVILQLNLKLKYGEDITLKFYVYTYILIKTQNLVTISHTHFTYTHLNSKSGEDTHIYNRQ